MKNENSKIRLVSPWEDNPSKFENFYGKSVKEEITEEAVTEKVQPVVKQAVEESIESQDPYYLILKDLAQE